MVDFQRSLRKETPFFLVSTSLLEVKHLSGWSMTNNLRPTRAVATDVANAVLDGSDAIILGAETLHGLHPVETVSTVSRICAEDCSLRTDQKHGGVVE
ncbi:pyruvate kinase 1, cytosolic-like [Cucumis melo]|uniref:Pyruvate kinase n=1 Tax=Cucumis melo TaxID=3656 RepID=A0ABM3L8M7_CUCME|nr:pyruvate kinase 1, cytosolic-like [Cucumis melo]XP_050946396.1 pyruvate kinase 1, cytosolic-like [Cucumis melo]